MHQSHRNISRRLWVRCLLAAATGALAAQAWGQTARPGQEPAFPAKAVRVVVPGGAGSGPDTLVRIIANRLGTLWGQPVVVENVVGAGGNIGHERVARAPADGYTVLVGMIGPMAINPSLQDRLGFDPLKDFQAVSLVSRYPNILVVHPSVPARNLQELVALAKAQPGRLRYGTPGTGTTPHLSAVMMAQMADVKMLEVPYKSSAQMTTDLIGGHIDLMFLNPAAVLQHVKAGSLRALAVTSTSRVPYAPDLPTMGEAGLPGYEVTSWYGLFLPAGAPVALVSRLNTDLRAVMNQPDMREQFVSRGDEPAAGSPEQATAYVRGEVAKWARLIKDAGIKAD